MQWLMLMWMVHYLKPTVEPEELRMLVADSTS